jgi:hypothetical protein
MDCMDELVTPSGSEDTPAAEFSLSLTYPTYISLYKKNFNNCHLFPLCICICIYVYISSYVNIFYLISILLNIVYRIQYVYCQVMDGLFNIQSGTVFFICLADSPKKTSSF